MSSRVSFGKLTVSEWSNELLTELIMQSIKVRFEAEFGNWGNLGLLPLL